MARPSSAEYVFTLSDLGRFVGVSPTTVGKYAAIVDFPAPVGNGASRRGLDFLAWWLPRKADREYQLSVCRSLMEVLGIGESSQAVAAVVESDDDEFGDRLKRAKALKQELELAEKQREFVRVADIADDLQKVIKHLRTGAEVLQRRFGSDASDILESSLQDAERELAELFS